MAELKRRKDKGPVDLTVGDPGTAPGDNSCNQAPVHPENPDINSAPAELPNVGIVNNLMIDQTSNGPASASAQGEVAGQVNASTFTNGEPVTGTVEDPVEILVGMAERGEIDPWNINIIEVTDKFLSELDRRRQLNLQISGRTLFFAATLLRMKSEQLEIVEPDEDSDAEGDDLFGDEYSQALDSEIDYTGRLGPIERLEHEIQRRLDRKNLRKSPITLFELISELKNIEREERRRRRMSSPSDDSLLYEADDIVSIAHEEGYEGSALTILAECFENVVEGELTLTELCKELEWGVSDVYIPLLFLALDGRCSLRQEEFYGDIWVKIDRSDDIAAEDLPEIT